MPAILIFNIGIYPPPQDRRIDEGIHGKPALASVKGGELK